MIDTILFDLDGTLLWFAQDDFINAYFAQISKVFIKLGMDAKSSVNAVWAGTKAMMLNDGSRLNKERFWKTFAEQMGLAGEKLALVEAECDRFYVNEFDTVKSVTKPNDISAHMVRTLAAKGCTVVLATNPLFPECAVETRLGWIGLSTQDFSLVTHYANSTYCKPHPGYYKEIFTKIGKTPEQCLMAGNTPAEDMSAGELGAETFLVTDYLENATGADITKYKRGTLAELETYLLSCHTGNI